MMRWRACAASRVAAVAVRGYTDARTVRTPAPYDQFLAAENQTYIEDMLRQYEADSALVDRSWVPVLEALKRGGAGSSSTAAAAADDAPVVATFRRPIDSSSLSEKQRLDNMRLSWMISEYEHNGHYLAAVNPLPSPPSERHRVTVDLGIGAFGFTAEDLSQVFNVSFGATYEATFVSGGKAMTLQQIVAQLQQMYCGTIGYEFMSCGYFDLRNWFRQEILAALQPLGPEDKRAIYDDVVKACEFERFLHLKYATAQRFGLDGGEAFIAAVNAAVAVAAGGGAQSCIVGMAHRGRLNFLANVCRKSLYAIFSEFEGKVAAESAHLDGDVKYHLGHCQQVATRAGRSIEIDLLPNPSHLEAVNGVVLGKARARQARAQDVEGTTVLPILVHGDASFAGQGSCYETMGLSDLSHFTVGGTLHIVINNQVGFTTNPLDTQAGVYCTALSRVNHAPVLHVNGDDVEACVRAARIAARFRQQFHRDIIVDIVCYRRNGHNEADLPDFTQPQLYEHIRHHHPTLLERYTATLVAEGVVGADEAASMRHDWQTLMRQSYERMQTLHDYVPVLPVFDPESENTAAEFEASKVAAARVEPPPPAVDSGVDADVLRRVGLQLTTMPHGMTRPHPVVERTYAARKKAVESGEGLEWCLAELLAFGTLALEGVPVRLTGEDVERGTFTQRHAGLTDTRTNLKYFPVASLSPSQAPVTICNSSLSEFGVCAFELGYNMENTKALTMWEAQFGDFANGAQVVFDQFLCCGEDKWNTPNSLVLSLPHGYSGAGPEHSSGRIERFLQLVNDVDHVPRNFRGGGGGGGVHAAMSPRQLLELRIRKYNMQVVYPSTPASYFHLLRRQAMRDFAKPLVIFFSKARLRAPNVSSLEELARGTAFAPVRCVDDALYASDEDTSSSNGAHAKARSSSSSLGEASRLVPRRLLFCTGQIESIVRDARTAMQATQPGVHNDVVLVTLEQLSPFPWEQVAEVVERYTRRNPAIHIAWLQEEPKNMGAWAYMRPRFNSLLRHLSAMPGTTATATTAGGSSSSSNAMASARVSAAPPLLQHNIDYIGRAAAASPSTGYGSVHIAEEQAIIAQCFA